jgi:hypothetical protein
VLRVLGVMRRKSFALAVAGVVLAAASLVSVASAVPPTTKCLIVNQRTDVRYATLQAANDAPQTTAGDTVMVKGTCVGTTTISKSITVAGKSNPGFGIATLDGDNIGTVVTVSTGVTVAISNLTVTHGDGNSGGGIFNDSGSLTLRNVRVSGNTASNGGGIYNLTGSLTAVNSTISDNTATSNDTPPDPFVSFGGGGIFNGGCHPFVGCPSPPTVVLTNVIITRNTATAFGGGINNGYASSVTLDGSTVSDNSAAAGAGIGTHGQVTLSNSAISGNTAIGGFGGGLFAGRFGSATLTNSAVSGNTAASGGGIALLLGGLTLNNSTVSGNTATYLGGGILNSGGGASLVNSTVTGNRVTDAAGLGGGIYNEDAALSLINSTVSGNIPDDIVYV